MKLQIVYENGEEPDEIIGIASFRDKLAIATRQKLLLMEHDEETTVKIRLLANRYGAEL